MRLRSLIRVNRKYFFSKSGWVEVERSGFRWRLHRDSYIGRMILEHSVFEPETTQLVQDLVKPGMHVLDIGANIGYYTLMLANCVGSDGFVWAFEPVTSYREQLVWHLEQNRLSHRVRVVPFGLSDTSTRCIISVGDTSATLHWTSDEPPLGKELITLNPLDDIANDLGIRHVDFIKLDIDGHEPKFLRGASELLLKYHPLVALEFAQHCLHIAGSDVREQARLLRELGYVICNEKTRKPFLSEMGFLMECGNFDHSGNALAVPTAGTNGN